MNTHPTLNREGRENHQQQERGTADDIKNIKTIRTLITFPPADNVEWKCEKISNAHYIFLFFHVRLLRYQMFVQYVHMLNSANGVDPKLTCTAAAR